MGQEIVYCSECALRLVGTDFDKGKAFRVQHKSLCADCARKVLGSLPTPPAPESPRSSSQRIPQIKPPGADSSARMRLNDLHRGAPAPPPKKSRVPLIAAAVGGAVVALAIVVAVASTAPPTRPGAGTPKGTGAPVDVAPSPREAEARAALEKSLEHGRLQPHDFEGLLARLQEAGFKAEGTSLQPRVRLEIEAARERARAAVSREIAALRGRSRPLLDRGDVDGLRKLVDGERGRLLWRDWDLELKRFVEEVERGASKPEPAPAAALWTPLEPREIHATWGSKAERQADQSILLGGFSPKAETVSFVASVPLKGLRAVRVEALPDPSLPAGGPGRASHGNAVLGELRVEAGGRPLAFTGASSTQEQEWWPASAAIDGHPLTGWGFSGRIGAASEAVFHAAEPFDGDALAVTIECQSAHVEHVLGRFRVSVSAAELPPPPPARPIDAGYAPPHVVYADEVHGWHDWSWATKKDFKSAEVPPYRGRHSLSGRFERNGAAFYFGKPEAIPVPDYLSFALYRTDADHGFPYAVTVWGPEDKDKPAPIPFDKLGIPPVRRWQRYVIPLSDFKPNLDRLRGIVLQCYETKFPTEPVYIDEVLLLSGPAVAAPPTPPPDSAWTRAAFLAAARDVDAALDVLKAPAEDVADLRLLRTLHEETRGLLAKWPRGWNISVDVLDSGGARRVDEPVLRADAAGLELRSGEIVAYGRILAPSLAELFLSRPKKAESDARAAALLCAIEGFPDAAKRHHPGPFKPGADPMPDPELRRALADAEKDYRAYATRQRALEKFAALLKEHGDTLLVRRVTRSLKARLDAPREFVYGTGDLRGSGSFAPRRHEKGVIAWTLTEDVEKAALKEHALELEYSAPAGTELRGWALVGGCCQETFTFYVRGTDVEGADAENPLAVPPKDVAYLKKTHAGHKQETERFAWVPLPPLKRGTSESATLRISAEHHAFAVAGLVLSSARKAAPKESEGEELLAGRPFAEPDLEPAGARGSILREVWRGIPGDPVSDLVNNPKYAGRPDRTDKVQLLDSSGLGDAYGQRLRGWLVPPASGEYKFWICSDDVSELWLSETESAADRKKIAGSGVTNYREWDKAGRSGGVQLRKNQRYYVEVLHKQGGGSDHLSVGWTLPDGSHERPIPGARLVPWTSGASVRPGARLDIPAAHPSGAPLPVALSLSGVGSAARADLFNGAYRLGEFKNDAYTWAQPPLGAHWLSARVSERGTRILSTSPRLVVVGDLHLLRAVDFNGPGGALDERPWEPAAGPNGHEGPAELRPPVDVARARMIRTSVALKDAAKAALAVDNGKHLVYATLWSPAEPASFDLALNGKTVLTGQRFNATGEWARLGPWAVEVVDGRLELSAPKGTAYLSGVEIWSGAKPAPKQIFVTEFVGKHGGQVFDERPEGHPLLVGFRLTLHGNFIQSLQGVYRAGERTSDGEVHGFGSGPKVEVLARPGYAVGGLRLRGGDRVYAFRVIFMKTDGAALNAKDRYESDWIVGDESNTQVLGGDGAPVVGVHGRRATDLEGLGLIQLK